MILTKHIIDNETISKKCQCLFSGKNKNNISNLTSADFFSSAWLRTNHMFRLYSEYWNTINCHNFISSWKHSGVSDILLVENTAVWVTTLYNFLKTLRCEWQHYTTSWKHSGVSDNIIQLVENTLMWVTTLYNFWKTLPCKWQHYTTSWKLSGVSDNIIQLVENTLVWGTTLYNLLKTL